MNQNVKLGGSFEDYSKSNITRNGWHVVRINDGCRQVNATKIIRVKQPFDFFAVKEGGVSSFYYDAKTVQGETYPYSKINSETNKGQIDQLLEIEKRGFVAGFVIHFRQNDSYCFASAKLLSEVVERGSLHSRACINIGKDLDISKLFLGKVGHGQE